MCGIVGYTGFNNASTVLIDTLAKLEYRGYDSVGIAVFEQGNIVTRKTKGRIVDLKKLVDNSPLASNSTGIGHTRWATHGEPTDINSHPHGSINLSLVHNGIIENYQEIKERMIRKGYEFISETDTEVIVKCLDYYYKQTNDILMSLKKLEEKLEGSYALAIIFKEQPSTIYAIRKDSPLIVGLSDNENFIASDMTALLKYTRKYLLLEENEIAVVRTDGITILEKDDLTVVNKEIQIADWDENVAEKQGYPHFMLKEIMEQPDVFSRAISGRIKGNVVDFSKADMIEDNFFEGIESIHIIGCGTAYHAGLVGQKVIQALANIPTYTHIASEFRYDPPLLRENDLVVLISQSGETADTVAAMRLAKEKGLKTLAICNVVGSTISRECDKYLLIHAQIEIAVASTKAYFAQLVVLYLVAFKLSQIYGLFNEKVENLLLEFKELRKSIEVSLKDLSKYQYIASKYQNVHNLFFIGRKMDYLLALEGSLKLKEISYIHCEAYPAGELKHGTISLIEENTPVIALASDSAVFDKTISNAQEVKTRGAKVLVITNQNTEKLNKTFDDVLEIEKSSTLLSCFSMIIPLQLLAYYVANLKGCDVDQPRNLAKSVTVE